MHGPPPDSLGAVRVALGDALRHPLLSAAEEHRLALAAQGGRQHERDLLVLRNLRLVFWIVSRYPDTARADLFQEGVIGLLRSVAKFDVSLGVRFSTHAVWWIRAYVYRAATRLDPAHGVRLVSLDDAGPGPDGRDLYDVLYDRTAALPEDAVLDHVGSPELLRMLELLLPQDREALLLWAGHDGAPTRTWVEVGQMMGISRETARKYVNRGLGVLRRDAGR
jgi:RNA polymerase sigma factor (sigma-70 family)